MTLWTILKKESRDERPRELGKVWVETAGALPFKVRLAHPGQVAPERWPRFIVVEGEQKKKGA